MKKKMLSKVPSLLVLSFQREREEGRGVFDILEGRSNGSNVAKSGSFQFCVRGKTNRPLLILMENIFVLLFLKKKYCKAK